MSTVNLGLPSLDAHVRLAGIVDEKMLRAFQERCVRRRLMVSRWFRDVDFR